MLHDRKTQDTQMNSVSTMLSHMIELSLLKMFCSPCITYTESAAQLTISVYIVVRLDMNNKNKTRSKQLPHTGSPWQIIQHNPP